MPNWVKNMWDYECYVSIRQAKQRCENKNATSFERYGGRGIKFLFSSQKEAFFILKKSYYSARRKHCLQRPAINRIDNDGHYEVGNIQWIPTSENTRQMHRDNRHNTRMKVSMKKNANNAAISRKKKVMCVTTGVLFNSAREAAKKTNATFQHISACCLNKRKSAGKTSGGERMVWTFV